MTLLTPAMFATPKTVWVVLVDQIRPIMRALRVVSGQLPKTNGKILPLSLYLRTQFVKLFARYVSQSLDKHYFPLVHIQIVNIVRLRKENLVSYLIARQ